MRKLKSFFSYSIAEEIMPDLSRFKSRTPEAKFALILNTGETLSISDVLDIKERTELSPLFFDVRGFSKSDLLRSYARGLGASIARIETSGNFAFAIRGCAFAVCEEAEGAFLSFLSHTPTYINAGDPRCRALIGKMIKLNLSSEMLIPYTKNRTTFIGLPKVAEEDFSLAIQKIRADIGADLKGFLF